MDANESKQKFQFSLLDLMMVVAMAAFIFGIARIGWVYWGQVLDVISDESMFIMFLLWTILETAGSIWWIYFLFKNNSKN